MESFDVCRVTVRGPASKEQALDAIKKALRSHVRTHLQPVHFDLACRI